MVTIGMNYDVLPGKETTFEKAVEKVIETMQQNPGHSTTHLYRRVGSGQISYLIISDWNQKEEFDAFVSSEAFAKVTQWGKENILAGRPKHQVYQGL